MLACMWYTELTCIPYSGLGPTLWVRSSALDCVCVCECRCLHACMHQVYRADMYTVFGPRADIVGTVLGPRLCVCM